MKELDLDVTNLVENRGSKVFISKEVLLNFLRESYYPFDIALEGLMSQSDIDEWVSPDKNYIFNSSDYNDHECGESCGHRLRFECGSISDTEFCFSAIQTVTDPYRGDPYGVITLILDFVGKYIPTSAFKNSYSNEYYDDGVDLTVSKLYFKEFREAILEAIHKHLKMYYWCCEYTERGFYCPHILEEDQV